MIEVVRKTKKKIQRIAKINRRCSRSMRDRLQEEDPEDGKDKNEDVRDYTKDEDYKMKITKDVPVEIDDEDVRQVFQNFL